VLHCIDALEGGYTYVALLQATSPLRAAADIDGAIAACARDGAPACVAVTAVAKSPWWMFTLDTGGRLRPLLEDARTDRRRQDLPEAFLPNGAVYVAEVDWLRRTRSFYGADTLAYVMPPERSVDIDSEIDLLFAEALLRRRA
jgi:CMP-N,N'-diacetyllegionaminic acid synthase